MQVYHKLKDFTKKYPRMAVALGMFDGVHIGHQSIIRRAVDLARSADGTSAVFTFSNHPLSVLSPQHMPLQLGTEALKEQRSSSSRGWASMSLSPYRLRGNLPSGRRRSSSSSCAPISRRVLSSRGRITPSGRGGGERIVSSCATVRPTVSRRRSVPPCSAEAGS